MMLSAQCRSYGDGSVGQVFKFVANEAMSKRNIKTSAQLIPINGCQREETLDIRYRHTLWYNMHKVSTLKT